MNRSDQPLAIVGFLFALSIGFWGRDMVDYVQKGPPGRYRITQQALTEINENLSADDVTEKLEKGLKNKRFETKDEFKGLLKGALLDKEFRGLMDPLLDAQFTKVYDKILPHAEDVLKVPEPERYKITEQTLTGINENLSTDDVTEKLGKGLKNKRFETKDEFKGLLKGALLDKEFRGLMDPLLDAQFTKVYDKILPHAEDVLKVRGGVVWGLTLLAGLVFLADIVCIMWWYAKYIHRIQTTATLGTYFLDFGVCAMFNVAANKWTTPEVFLGGALLALVLLIWRFIKLYNSPDANDTDKRILKASLRWFYTAWGVCLAFLGLLVIIAVPILMERKPEFLEDIGGLFTQGPLYPFLVGVLSLFGILLTIKFRRKIQVSAHMHEKATRRFTPMELHWPPGLSGDAKARQDITGETRNGLKRFRELFKGEPGQPDHERARSRVHPEGDLRVQSYVLGTPSWTRNGKEKEEVEPEEVEAKAFMVGVSHWLDDLVDGRGEFGVYQKLKRPKGLLGVYQKLKGLKEKKTFGLTLEDSKEVFERVYKKIVVNHTNKEVYAKLIQGIEDSVLLPDNRKYLFFSLNRVAVGAAVFGPEVKESLRKDLLETHNSRLTEIIKDEDPEGKDRWHQDLLKLLTNEMRGDPSDLGKILLGLTTKTVQEMAMASERQDVCFSLSVLYSLLYAPLLYFHDVDGELECSEMVPLETFDVSYDGIMPWLERMKGLLTRGDAPEDQRRDSRLKQLQMAFQCFKPNLPQVARDTLEQIYKAPPPEESAGQ